MLSPKQLANHRLLSLDAYRGLTMFLLMAEASLVYVALTNYFSIDSAGGRIIEQFHHHPWNGLRFWDLIQPFFMFIVGVAMPFSLNSRLKKGDTWNDAFKHILWRCLILFLLGIGLHCVYSGAIVFELWNVLTQLSFTILIAFILMLRSWSIQLGSSFLILMLAELLYRAYDPSTPFIKDQNFGSWLDMILMGKINEGGGWVTINCLSTAAHTIWGVLCGQLLLSDRSNRDMLKIFLIGGVIGLFLGYGLDMLQITPIIKRIATTSFVLASGGWAILALTFFYWLVDIRGVKSWTRIFMIVGANSIFIYLFAETIGHQWLTKFGPIWTTGLFEPLGVSSEAIAVISGFFTLFIMWYICAWLYKRKIFFKI